MIHGNSSSTAGFRKSIRLVIVMAIIAWTLQMVLVRCGYAAEPTLDQTTTASLEPVEKFVPGTSRFLSGATLELRGEATITGGDVKLKQICRWSDRDKTAFQPIEDLIVVHMGSAAPFRGLSQKELKALLQDAGVNLAVIRFAGMSSCTITRSDVTTSERSGLQDWIDARQGNKPAEIAEAAQPAMSKIPRATENNDAAQLASVPVKPALIQDTPAPKSLRDLLVIDLSERLSLEPNSIQMKFNPTDEKLLSLAEPHFQFNIDGQRARGLGNVSWDITLIAGESRQKATIDAVARAWQNQLVVLKPMAYHQTIRAEDLLDRRALVDQLTGEATLKREQVVGQWAGQDLRAGSILTPRLIEAAPLVKTGQLVTVIAEQGTVQIKAVARAMNDGSFGQTIRVKNETTGDIYEATLTAAQTAKVSGPLPGDRSNVAAASN
jgi:flagella basal body P-ring formation protein FlgA